MTNPTSDTCEVCKGAQAILVADELYQDGDGQWRWTKKRVFCPECTDEGRRWADEESRKAHEEHERDLAARAVGSGVFVHIDYRDDEEDASADE